MKFEENRNYVRILEYLTKNFEVETDDPLYKQPLWLSHQSYFHTPKTAWITKSTINGTSWDYEQSNPLDMLGYLPHKRSWHKDTILSGAIIRDGDHKRALTLLLGLSPWYGTIFLFLEQIAP